MFWVYFVTIVLILILPINNSEKLKNLNHITVIKVRGDYFFHALTFLPWALFGPAMNKKTWLWMVTGMTFSMGAELLQYILPYRRFNVNDLIANGFGVFLGSIIMIILLTIISRFSSSRGTISNNFRLN